MSEFNPLVQRVDALLKRHQQQPDPAPAEPATGYVADTAPATATPDSEDDIPVLTEVVEPAATLTPAQVAQIETAVLEKVLAAFEGTLDQHLGRVVSDLVAQAADGLRADLSVGIRDMARDAVAAAVRQELAERSRRG
ncbi:MAG: hypothetical protein JSS40_12430 [Proteobacteria bacterium]|nr:hypothetical protein [Pseudomonadota bacterium]